jgi:hypothetical protein
MPVDKNESANSCESNLLYSYNNCGVDLTKQMQNLGRIPVRRGRLRTFEFPATCTSADGGVWVALVAINALACVASDPWYAAAVLALADDVGYLWKADISAR